MVAGIEPQRTVGEDGSTFDIFALPADPASLEELLRDLFLHHWQEITFGPIIQGFRLGIARGRGPRQDHDVRRLSGRWPSACPTSISASASSGGRGQPQTPELAHHRRTGSAELYRQLSRDFTPISWGLRLFNGKGQQQITVLLPNPFLHPETDKILKAPDWSRLALWDGLRSRWCGLAEPDPFDRSGTGFRHG